MQYENSPTFHKTDKSYENYYANGAAWTGKQKDSTSHYKNNHNVEQTVIQSLNINSGYKDNISNQSNMMIIQTEDEEYRPSCNPSSKELKNHFAGTSFGPNNELSLNPSQESKMSPLQLYSTPDKIQRDIKTFKCLSDSNENNNNIKDSSNKKDNLTFNKNSLSIKESLRMCKELVKCSIDSYNIFEEFNLDKGAILKVGNSLENNCDNSFKTCKNELLVSFKRNNTSMIMDEPTRLLCSMAIPRIVTIKKRKLMMCLSPSRISKNNNKISYSLIFRTMNTMKLDQIYDIDSLSGCEGKNIQSFIIQYIHKITFIKISLEIMTNQAEDCKLFVKGISFLINHRYDKF